MMTDYNDLKWKYIIPFSGDELFSVIEDKYGRTVSSELKDLVHIANAATPSRYLTKIGNRERVLGSILDFNVNEIRKDSDSVITALEAVDQKSLLPFAIDPFGNYFCMKGNTVVFLNMETGKSTDSQKSLISFIDSLY